MICGYLRVSTYKQKKDGVSIDSQKKMIIDYAIRFENIKKKTLNSILMRDIQQVR